MQGRGILETGCPLLLYGVAAGMRADPICCQGCSERTGGTAKSAGMYIEAQDIGICE